MSNIMIPAAIVLVCVYVWFLIFIPVAHMWTPQRGKIEAPDALTALRHMSEGYDNHFNAGTPLMALRIAELEAEVEKYKWAAELLQTELLQAAIDHDFGIPTLAARLAKYEAERGAS